MYTAASGLSGDMRQLPILMIAAIAVFAYLRFLNRHPRKPDIPAVEQLDKVTLDTVADEQLVSTVIAYILSKTDKKNPQPLVTLPQLGEMCLTVYCVWVYDRWLCEGGFARLKQSPDAQLHKQAITAFETIGATACAQAITQAFTDTDKTDVDNMYFTAADAENPLTLCIAYIRDAVNTNAPELS